MSNKLSATPIKFTSIYRQSMGKRSTILVCLVSIIILCACQASDNGLTTETSLPTSMPTVVESETTPSDILPFSLYFIGSGSGQIMRLEPDGKTSTQITFEAEPILDFDVSPIDGTLVYLCNNDLILTSAFGQNRKVLIDGVPLTLEESRMSENRWTEILDSPRWSPDGMRIAYGLGGVRLVSVTDGESLLVQPNDAVDFSDMVGSTGSRRFRPVSWSPDGARLLLAFATFPEAGGHAVKNLDDGDLTEVQQSSGIYFTPSWSTDSSQVYRSDAPTAMIGCSSHNGFHVANAATGEIRFLITGTDYPESACAIVKNPYLAKDGQLYMFGAFASIEQLYFEPVPVIYTMYRAAPDGTHQVALCTDIHNIGTALWSPDASGAVIKVGDSENLMWLRSDCSEPVALSASGSVFRWGHQ